MGISSKIFMAAIGISIAFGCQHDSVNNRINRALKTNNLFPEIAIPAPKQPWAKVYLGLIDMNNFTIKDLQADVVVVEILNTHCSSCKKQARSYNKLFNLIKSDPKTRERIKIFGIAVGNNADEAQKFQEEYHIPYPIIPDPDFLIHRAIGISKTPYSYYIRKDLKTKSAHIIGTYLGANLHYENLFDELLAMLSVDIPTALSAKLTDSNKASDGLHPLSKNEIEIRVQAAFKSVGGKLGCFKEIPLQSSGYVYAGELEKGGQKRKLFAVAASRIVPCDVCHDAHFIYVFDNTGKILLFEPIQLTKYDNKLWDNADLLFIRSRILGKFISHPVSYNPKVDAVSSATITSAVIYNDLLGAQKLYKELKRKGFLQ